MAATTTTHPPATAADPGQFVERIDDGREPDRAISETIGVVEWSARLDDRVCDEMRPRIDQAR